MTSKEHKANNTAQAVKEKLELEVADNNDTDTKSE